MTVVEVSVREGGWRGGGVRGIWRRWWGVKVRFFVVQGVSSQLNKVDKSKGGATGSELAMLPQRAASAG